MQRIWMWNMSSCSQFASTGWPQCQLMGKWLHKKPATSLHIQDQEHSVFWRVAWICHFKASKGTSTKHLEKWGEKDLGSNPKLCNLPQTGLFTYTTKEKQTSIPNWTDHNLNTYAWCDVCTSTLQKPNIIFTSEKVLMTFNNVHPQSFYISQTVTSVSMLNTQEYSCNVNQPNFLTARYSNNLNNLYF